MSVMTPEQAPTVHSSVDPTASVIARARSIAPWIAIVLLGALAIVALGWRSAPEPRLLDPRSSSSIGSKAITEVLRQRGVDVTVATALADLPQISAGTTVVVTADERLSPQSITDLVEHARDADRLVILLTQPEVVREVAPGARGYALPDGFADLPSGAAARCAVSDLRPGDVVTGGTVGIAVDDSADIETCLPTVIGDGHAMLAALPADEGRPETLLVGFAAGLTNALITTEDTAAVAVRMLGHSPRLVWLIPSGIDGPTSGDSYSPWPSWTTPVAVVLALGTVLLALVRGRRLGRLSTEPLPVTVRAAETTESRGHLYRRSRDRARTAAILRDGTRRRLGRRLGVARTDPLDTLITAVAAATGEPRDRIQTLLADAEPATTRELVTLGNDLADLERKVRLS